MRNICAKRARGIGGLGAAALLAAALAAGPAAAQSAQYDGLYAGTQTLSERGPAGTYSQCLRGPFKRRMAVKDNIATYTFNPTYQGQVSGPVSADGAVSGNNAEPSGGVALSGKIAGGRFTGEVWSLYCTYAVELKRVPR
ncbi:MAG TPA: hypothetical protein VG308_03130 [Stellaceae bacterium]|jgi:hypothetical protein|nr:hypothetical protein [Stellaceae bacterium]